MASRRVGLLLVIASVAVAAVVVLVVVLSGGDDPAGRTVRGDAQHGYPLRGSLAQDEEVVRSAVAAWRDWDAPAPASDDDVTVLWAGRSGGQQVAILASDGGLAEATRTEDGEWAVRAAARAPRPLSARQAVGVGRSVLVPVGDVSWSYRAFGRGPEDIREVDGLYWLGRSPVQGFVWPSVSLEGTETAVIHAVGLGDVTVDGETFGELRRISANPQAGGLWSALKAADKRLDFFHVQPRDGDQRLRILLHDSYVYEVVAVSLSRFTSIALAVGHDDEGTVLGVGDAPSGEGVSGAGAIEIDGKPWLVLAGVDAPFIRARVGSHHVARPGPVSVVNPTSWLRDGTLPPVEAVDGRNVRALGQ